MLDEIYLFEHVILRQTLWSGQNRTVTPLKISSRWCSDMEQYSRIVKFRLSVGKMPHKSNRLDIFDLVFKRCIPPKEIWAGRFETDGLNLRMASHSLAVCVDNERVRDAFTKGKVTMKNCTSSKLLEIVVKHCLNSATDTTHFLKNEIGTASSCGSSNPQSRLLHIIRTSGWYARNHLTSQTVTFISSLPKESTKGGLPKDIVHLNPDNATSSLTKIQAWAAEHEGNLAIAGDDMGIRFSHAIHLHDPAKPFFESIDNKARKVVGKRKREKEDASEGHGSSKTFLLTPHALQEISRRSTFDKQRMRDRFPVSTLEILNAVKKQILGDPQLLLLYNLADTALKCSQPYSHSSFRATQQKRRYADKIAAEFCQWAWPGVESRPILFVIGDGCGLSTAKVRKHHVDSSTSTLRSLIKRLRNMERPVMFVTVDEYLSSQVCPDPGCKVEDDEANEAEAGTRCK